jgi:hypothetical protein
LMAPNRIDPDSANRNKVESKKDMAKRGIRSPDGGDALALTFAFKVADREVAEMAKVLGIGHGRVNKRKMVPH